MTIFKKIKNLFVKSDVAENVTEYNLKTYPQKSANTVRYYYKGNYLFSASEDYFNEIQIEFNRLMNLTPKLSLKEVQVEIRKYKEELEEKNIGFLYKINKFMKILKQGVVKNIN